MTGKIACAHRGKKNRRKKVRLSPKTIVLDSPVLLQTESVPCVDRDHVAAPLISLCYIATIYSTCETCK